MKRFIAALLTIALLFGCIAVSADDARGEPDTQTEASEAEAGSEGAAEGSENPDAGEKGSAAGDIESKGDLAADDTDPIGKVLDTGKSEDSEEDDDDDADDAAGSDDTGANGTGDAGTPAGAADDDSQDADDKDNKEPEGTGSNEQPAGDTVTDGTDAQGPDTASLDGAGTDTEGNITEDSQSDDGPEGGSGTDTETADGTSTDASQDAYILTDGNEKTWGTVYDLAIEAAGASKTVYIVSGEQLSARIDAELLINLTFLPDADIYPDGYEASVSLAPIPKDADPDSVEMFDAQAYCASAGEDHIVTVYIRVLKTTGSVEEPEKDAYILAKNGEKDYGKVSELAETAFGKEETIYIVSSDQLTVETDARFMTGLVFVPDPDTFSEGYTAVVSMEEIAEEADPADITAFDAEGYLSALEGDDTSVKVFIRVLKVPEQEADEVTIAVEHTEYDPGKWSSQTVGFTLSGIPEDRADLRYSVVLFDEKIIELDGNEYTCDTEGITALRFAITDDIGDMLSVTPLYTLYIDLTPPESEAYAYTEKSYTLILSAQDALSETIGISLDAGETWDYFDNGYLAAIKNKNEVTYPAGSILIRDEAGNIWTNPEDIVCGKVRKQSGGGGGGGGKRKEHSENKTGNDGKTTYSAADLTCPEETITSFEVDGHDITLLLSHLEGDASQACGFTAVFGKWMPEDPQEDMVYGIDSFHTGDMEESDNILLLNAVIEESEEDKEDDGILSCRWQFDGYALKTLSNSGIEYLVLCADGKIAALPAKGFTSGPAYTELKIGGTSTKRFFYSVDMIPAEREPDETNINGDMEVLITVEVVGSIYELLPGSEKMYAENVWSAPADAVEYPYHTYPDEIE